MMYTNWASRYTGDEETLGTLQPGKLADLVVVDGDFLKWPAENLSKLKVIMTMIGGRAVYRDTETKIEVK